MTAEKKRYRNRYLLRSYPARLKGIGIERGALRKYTILLTVTDIPDAVLDNLQRDVRVSVWIRAEEKRLNTETQRDRGAEKRENDE